MNTKGEIPSMFLLSRNRKLVKDDLKEIAKLMYQDVSEDPWDKENLTKRNLNFSIESVRLIDLYVHRLMNTEMGKTLLDKHFENFVNRLGAYLGEVIKSHIKQQDFNWYEFNSVNNYSICQVKGRIKPYTLLYSKKRDVVIMPLFVTSEYLEGRSTFPNFLVYVEEMTRQHSY
ncbi:hypothetical protein [Litchfieldia alkalitelluris]|uniref:hypothetical protein n=1 Tax=Litchfieldia alkalitelluris TaxID=304268 RepID=UPI001F16B1AC|nr:hypothetical protein [Litchfieldia alkalitelluris]